MTTTERILEFEQQLQQVEIQQQQLAEARLRLEGALMILRQLSTEEQAAKVESSPNGKKGKLKGVPA